MKAQIPRAADSEMFQLRNKERKNWRCNLNRESHYEFQGHVQEK